MENMGCGGQEPDRLAERGIRSDASRGGQKAVPPRCVRAASCIWDPGPSSPGGSQKIGAPPAHLPFLQSAPLPGPHTKTRNASITPNPRQPEAPKTKQRKPTVTGLKRLQAWRALQYHTQWVGQAYARTSLITCPCTSVRRRSTPLVRMVSFSCSIPSRCRMVACRS